MTTVFLEMPWGSTIVSYRSLRSPVKSPAPMLRKFTPYCSNIHQSQPPGMLFAPRNSPILVPSLSWNPLTSGARSAA
ncbi:hypothetical protein ACFQHO_45570 [Actinomadura yumaensis]|uniref:hypothetical protein n=1 Tax=Actinomadura yumaensis TaxID=111807 RepID=UPI00360ECF99